jgi:hypothetical protein
MIFRLFLVLSLVPMAIHPQSSEPKSRFKIGAALSAVFAVAGLHFIKRKPIKLERIAQNVAVIQQNPLLSQRYSSTHEFLRAYEQKHMIPEAIKKLEDIEQSLEKSMNDMTQIRYSAQDAPEQTGKCGNAFDAAYNDLKYVRSIKESLVQFSEPLK